MDFHGLSRKELQALCKKNKIPANQTNLAMAQSLSALPQVEGLDEILKPVEADGKQPQLEKEIGTPDVDQYIASKRWKVVSVDVTVSPADSVSTRRKKPIGHVPKTPAASTTVTRACTRRSTRLLDKKLSKMSSVDSGDVVGSMKFDDVSQQPHDSAEAEPNNSKLKSEESFETGNDSVEVSEQLDLNKSIAKEVQECYEAETENETGMETMQDVPVDVSMEVTDNNGGDDSAKKSTLFGEVSEVAFMEVTADHDVAALTVEVPDGAPMEGTDQAITDSHSLLSDRGDSVCQRKPVETIQDLPIEPADDPADDAFMDVPDVSMEVTENKGGNLPIEPTDDPADDAFMDVPDNVSMEVTDNKGGNDSTEKSALFGKVFEIASIEVADDASVEATDAFAGSLSKSSDSGDSVSQNEPVVRNTDDINTVVDGDFIAEEIGTPHLESMTVARVDIPIQATVADQLMGESYSPARSEVADEHIEEEDGNKVCIMKENSLQDMSIGQLRKMLKNLTIIDGGKSNCKTINVASKIDSKRTALQALPENNMTE